MGHDARSDAHAIAHAYIVLRSRDAADGERLAAGTLAAGAQPIAVASAPAFVEAVDYWFPSAALLDIDAAEEEPDGWQHAVRRCKLRPHTRGVPLLLYGDWDDASRAAARNAGADALWTRDALFRELPKILAACIQPPIVYPAGWEDALSAKARKGVDEFNRGEFYEQHEWLEHAWMEEERPIRDMYQGILQVGVAFYHIEAENWTGALKMFRRGLPRLRALPPVCQGVDIAALRINAEAIHREVTALGRARLAEFDRSRFPSIRLVDNDEDDGRANNPDPNNRSGETPV